MRMANARAHINYLIESKQDFVLTSSNYSTGIDNESWSEKYVANMQSVRTFAAFAKLKKAIKEKQVPNIDREDVIYYTHNFKDNVYIESVVNIDLKSAYATILYNDGYIGDDAFNYLMRCKKQERLSSVGMLASRKEIFTFEKGDPKGEPEEVVSPNSGFFFYAVKRTYEIMDELRRICGNDYLYTWVDGIYFLPDPTKLKMCQEYLRKLKFNFTTDILSQFEVRIKQDMVLVQFIKEGKRKIFNLPGIESEFKRILTDSILLFNDKNKNNEKDQDQNHSRIGGRNRKIHRRE